MIVSQNHRMIWDGRDIKDHAVPTPLPWTGMPPTSSGHNCRGQDGSKQTGGILAPGALVRTLISGPRLENEVTRMLLKVFLH